jgi:hypothetical protein
MQFLLSMFPAKRLCPLVFSPPQHHCLGGPKGPNRHGGLTPSAASAGCGSLRTGGH